MSPATDPRSYATHPPIPLGGALCLDFINTTTWRGNPERSAERLHDYAELVHWAAGLELIDAHSVTLLLTEAHAQAQAAEQVHEAALRLRLEIEQVFDPAHEGLARPAEAEALLRDIERVGRLTEAGEARIHHWQPSGSPPDLRLPLLPVAVSVLELAASRRRYHLRRCADPSCGWVFLDETRNQSRQWCSMEGCGNRAKARAHYARRKARG
ncbi:CGNR zinc finger domain-containing protein [Bosea sp. 2KB_26]|uniref:CGNR zinc finger domain-containing protein n=1 Tax=Bosea sp. 2KB_26 TaxID=3237475 RepID=UPI003F8DE842